MPRNTGTPSLSPGQAAYVLDRLLSERRLTSSDLSRYVSEMHAEIGHLEARLQSLRDASGASTGAGSSGSAQASRGPGRPAGSTSAGAGAAAPVRRRRRRRSAGSTAASATGSPAAAGSSAGPSTRTRATRKRKAAITPEQLASRQLQGRYLALVRQIPATKRAQYARIAKEKGREAAIQEMQGAVRK